jgi:hypothetical protein
VAMAADFCLGWAWCGGVMEDDGADVLTGQRGRKRKEGPGEISGGRTARVEPSMRCGT